LLFALPGQLLRRKAAFKAFVTSHVSLDVTHLPYNRKLLQFLHEESARGCVIYLAYGADLRSPSASRRTSESSTASWAATVSPT